MKRVLVAGGGITGLSLAYFLSKVPGIQVTLVDASERLGGTIGSQRRDGFLLESGADSFISEKSAGVDLAKELAQRPDQAARSTANFEGAQRPAVGFAREAPKLILQAVHDLIGGELELFFILSVTPECHVVMGIFLGSPVPVLTHLLADSH